MPAATFRIENGQLGLSTTDPGVPLATASISDYTDFSCQVTVGQITPQPNLETETTPATFCDKESEVDIPQDTKYELDITALADPHVAAGLQDFLFTNDTNQIWFFLSLDSTTTAEDPKAIGTCYCLPAVFGGEARTVLVAPTVTMPIIGKPEIQFGAT